MAQDIRELLKQEKKVNGEKLPQGHQQRFLQRLDEALPQEEQQNSRYLYLKIAAVFIVVLGVGFFYFYQQNSPIGTSIADTPVEEKHETPQDVKEMEQVTLADISPEFKKIEEYYLANLNLGLSKIDITEENKALIDAFMVQLSELDKEYSLLNTELNQNGFNGETIEALIQNLQLRLDLLFKLKNKLDELKKEKNEKFEKITA